MTSSTLDSDVKKYLYHCSQDIEFFAHEFLPHYLTHVIPNFHSEIYGLLKTEDRLLILAPREFAKSFVCVMIYSIWATCFRITDSILIISKSENLAIEHIRRIKKELESNEKILKLFGVQKTEKWSESHIVTRGNVDIKAKGAGGQIRGLHPGITILDDLEDRELCRSEDRRKELEIWVRTDCLGAVGNHGRLVYIGNIVHPFSILYEFYKDQSIIWTKKFYRAYNDGVEESGHELWPDYWPHDRLQGKKREIGSSAFYTEYMNTPVSDVTAPIKPEHIRYYTDLPAQHSLVLAVDPAYSEDQKADYKVASLIAMDEQSNRYLVHYLRTHAPLGEFIDGILNIWLGSKNRITGIGIPNSGTEKSFYSSFLTRAQERKLYPPVQEVVNAFKTSSGGNVRGKLDRIVAVLQPLFEQGKYYIQESHEEAKDEILSLTFSKHDDIVDTMAYAEQLLQPIFYDIRESEVGLRGSSPKFIKNYGMGE